MTELAIASDTARLHGFIKRQPLAVIATASNDGMPEAALVNIAVTPSLDVIFETTSATRKFVNLHANPRVSLVIGWEDDQTLQVDGLVDQPEGAELDSLRTAFLSVFPEKASHEAWPGNDYYRVRPRWMRLSNYNSPRKIEEFRFPVDESRYPELRRSWWRRFRSARRTARQHN